jgi:hypothetical protein
MKLLFSAILCCVGLFSVSCGSLNSVTTIAPNKSFVLGENKHLGYTASVKNIAASSVEVLLTVNNETNSLGVLRPNESRLYKVAPNSTVTFKNMNNTPANIKIKLIGDTNLSMGYKDK